LIASKREKNEDDLKQRLKTSWRKIYRAIVKLDEEHTGQVRMAEFIEVLHQNGCFVSRDEVLKNQRKYGNNQYRGSDVHDKHNLLDYDYFSKDMGLHHSYLDFI